MIRRCFLVVVIALAILPPALWGLRRLAVSHRAAPGGEAVLVHLPKGASLNQASALLAKSGVVDSARLFKLAARLSGKSSCLKAGEYRLGPYMTNAEILGALCAGRVVRHRLAIPEGFTAYQVVDRAAGLGLINRQKGRALITDAAFINSLGLRAKSLEGFLFPATYRMPKHMGARAVLARMVRKFQREWRLLKSAAKARGLDMAQAVTLASIIEREVMADSERPLVSAVYHNRLKRGMRLQADPTVIYGMENFDGNLRKADLKSDTPYNTYLHAGLPPGPICNPGRASLEAAVMPADADYLYFVAKGDGTHHFSRTYRSHARAVNRYQKKRR